MICYELFEGRKPFDNMDAMSAARSASLFDRRPSWGKHNRRVFPPSSAICGSAEIRGACFDSNWVLTQSGGGQH